MHAEACPGQRDLCDFPSEIIPEYISAIVPCPGECNPGPGKRFPGSSGKSDQNQERKKLFGVSGTRRTIRAFSRCFELPSVTSVIISHSWYNSWFSWNNSWNTIEASADMIVSETGAQMKTNSSDLWGYKNIKWRMRTPVKLSQESDHEARVVLWWGRAQDILHYTTLHYTILQYTSHRVLTRKLVLGCSCSEDSKM